MYKYTKNTWIKLCIKKSCDTNIKTFFSFDCVQITNKVDFNNSNKASVQILLILAYNTEQSLECFISHHKIIKKNLSVPFLILSSRKPDAETFTEKSSFSKFSVQFYTFPVLPLKLRGLDGHGHF